MWERGEREKRERGAISAEKERWIGAVLMLHGCFLLLFGFDNDSGSAFVANPPSSSPIIDCSNGERRVHAGLPA